MDINGFIEPFQQFGQHFQDIPEQARQLVDQHIPAPQAPESPQVPEAPKNPVVGSL